MLVLVFPALIFAIVERGRLKRGFYLLSAILFVFIIVLTISQGAYLGLAVGIMYFFFLYPTRNLLPEKRKKITYIKIAFIALIILAVMATLFIKSSAYAINENYLFRQLTTWQIDNSRLSAWQVAIKAFLDRPILGYGPENFSIGFDRHYDPSLPLLAMAEGAPASWWDKAHNFALNLLVETGIIGFLAFSLLFGLIFWRLHKLAHGKPKEDEGQNYEHINPIVAHGMQTALVAYFANLMFNFENFSSYIIVFLIVGFTLHLTIPQDAQSADIRPNFLSKRRKIIAGTAFALLVLFLWFFTIKPFGANAKVNMAKYLAENRMCKQAIAIMEKELKRHSIIDGYARLQYIAMLKICVQAYPENDVAYAKHAITALQENVKIMPHYTRNWLWMVAFNNIVAVAETDPEKKKELIQRSREYLKTAEELSPNRHEALTERLSIYLFEEDYESSEQISQNCIKKYPYFNACYWYLGVSQIYLSGNNKELLEEGKKNMEKAHSMGYTQLSQYSLTKLSFMYIDKRDYKELEWVYKQLTQLYPYNPRYFAGLAIVHKRNGKIKESTEALKSILRIQSEDRPVEYGWTESQETITLLIENILELPKSSPSYHLTLHQLYLQMADEETDPNQSEIYKKKAEEEYNLSKQ